MHLALLLASTSLLLQATPAQEHARRAGSPLDDATTYALRGEERPARVPFEFVANQVRVAATIQGQGPFTLILDTGMPIGGVLLFRGPRVEALDLDESGQPVRVAGAGGEGGAAEARRATGIAIDVGAVEMRSASALVIDRPAGFTPRVDGVIGGALFFRYVVRIDVGAGRLELSQPEGWSPPAEASVVPLELDSGRIFATVRVAVGAEEPVPASVVVDTGASHALSLNAGEGGRFAPPETAIDAPLGRGTSGVVRGKAGRVRRVEIGAFAFENVVTSFPVEEHQHPGRGDFRDGNLGQDLLRRFHVTFDYAGKRLVLEEGPAFAEPFERDMSGMAVDWTPDGSAVVREVMPDSPAAAGGLRAGDVLLAIDHDSIETLGDGGVRAALMKPGAYIPIEIRRAGKKLEKWVRLKRIV